MTDDGGEPEKIGGGLLPINGLMGMCLRMGSHFHDWIDYKGVAFTSKLSGFCMGRKMLASGILKWRDSRRNFNTEKQMHQNVFTVDGKQSVLHLEHQMCHFMLG